MPPRKRKAWVKLWPEWFTSISHATFSNDTHVIGLRCILIAGMNGWDESGTGWVTTGGMSADIPLDISDIARLSGVTLEVAEAALTTLMRVGTIVVRGDGAYGFPGLRDWQESRDAERKRQHRTNGPSTDAGMSTDIPPECPSIVLPMSGSMSASEVRGQRAEEDQDKIPSGSSTTAPRTGSVVDTGRVNGHVDSQNGLRIDSATKSAPEVSPKLLKPQRPSQSALTQVGQTLFSVRCLAGAKRDPEEWNFTDDFARKLQEAFPGVDVIAEARKAALWTETNSRKTFRGMPAYMRSWMAKAQDKAGRLPFHRPMNNAEHRLAEQAERVRQAELRVEERRRAEEKRRRETEDGVIEHG